VRAPAAFIHPSAPHAARCTSWIVSQVPCPLALTAIGTVIPPIRAAHRRRFCPHAPAALQRPVQLAARCIRLLWCLVGYSPPFLGAANSLAMSRHPAVPPHDSVLGFCASYHSLAPSTALCTRSRLSGTVSRSFTALYLLNNSFASSLPITRHLVRSFNVFPIVLYFSLTCIHTVATNTII
jgi:hypothetical protein